MITGESGTGKELVAKGIHQAGPMPQGPFIAVNVSAIPASMFESQFFGHAKGAFTGAETPHQGYFEQADGGTLFLDEIGELPIGLQAKLLRVLEEKSFYPLGASKPVWVDVRVISASNSDIEKACQEGQFQAGSALPAEISPYPPASFERKTGRYSFACVPFSAQGMQ